MHASIAESDQFCPSRPDGTVSLAPRFVNRGRHGNAESHVGMVAAARPSPKCSTFSRQ